MKGNETGILRGEKMDAVVFCKDMSTSTLKQLLHTVDREMHESIDDITTEDYMKLLDLRNAIVNELKTR